ncbi:MAG: tetratricopeptide repeat protein [Nitrospina sp.]|jgi:tetratricopeptide (TPR) repeat protein|nr:tetratricopeptide repeat protein [Nitrospina sp.]MBT6600871.1 tetratricopeptide repeat protein [Nitrospina sp.]
MSRSNFFLLLTTIWILQFILTPNTWAQQEKAEDWFLKGNLLSSKGHFEEAVDAYKKSIDHNPSATVSYFNLSLAYKKLNMPEEAAVALEKAVAIEPGYLDARSSLGNTYNHLERWEDAIAQLNVVVHRRQDDADAHGNLGWAYYNFKKGPPFKHLVIINLRKAVQLFESKNQVEAAISTQKVLEDALVKFNLNGKN